jgi:hypothetical protein
MATLTLDLCPYDVDFVDGTMRIHDVGGSVLKKLDNRMETTRNRFSEMHCTAKIGANWCCFDYEGSDENFGDVLVIMPMDGWELPEFDELVSWLSLNYDRIQSIGWEMLEKP